MNARDKVVKARGQMLNVAPFWATISLMLKLREDSDCPTMATDGREMIFNPDFVEKLTMEELQGVCAHEAAHVVFEHMLRRNEREPRRWNVAGDFAINALIRESFKLPERHLFSSDYDGLTVEQIYERLPEGAGGGKGGSGEGKDGGGSDPGGCGEVRDYEGEGEGEGEGKDGKEDKDGGGKRGGGASKTEIEKLQREIKIAVTQAGQIAKGFGNIPAGLQKIIDSIKEPRIDWREVLRRFVSSSAKNDFSWRRPNRRLISDDVYLPSLYSEDSVGGIVVAIDTSGSCWSDEVMTEFCAELNAIVGNVRGDCRILYADTQVQKEVIFTETDRPITLEPLGGGGTDFCPVFEHVEKLPDAPTCLIYLTDMEGRFPTTEPPYPVLWALVGYYRQDMTAPFGEIVPLGESRRRY